MKVSLIACINKVGALGKDNKLLYHIKEDLANFKRLTVGNILIMGRNTYKSLPKKPLPNRTTIIISNDADYVPEVEEDSTVFVCDSIKSALSVAETLCTKFSEEVFVVGGASIYHQFIEQDLIDEMILTLVDDDTTGDVTFPNIKTEEWKTVFKLQAQKKTDEPSYGIILLRRNTKNGQ